MQAKPLQLRGSVTKILNRRYGNGLPSQGFLALRISVAFWLTVERGISSFLCAVLTNLETEKICVLKYYDFV